MHHAAEVSAQHHHVARYDVILLPVLSLLPASFSPQRRIGGEHHIALLGQIVTHPLAAIKRVHPSLGVVHHGRVLYGGDGAYHLLLAYEEMGTMVMQQVDGRMRPIAVGNQQIGGHPIPTG